MGLPDRRHRRLQCARGVEVSHPACFYLLMIVSLVLLVVNWREDPGQRTGLNLWLWATRVAIGCMWFQGTLWKLPFGRQNGLNYWTEQMAGRAAFEIHREFVTNVILPNFE